MARMTSWSCLARNALRGASWDERIDDLVELFEAQEFVNYKCQDIVLDFKGDLRESPGENQRSGLN